MKKILSVLSAFCVAFTLTAQTELLENPGFEEATSSPLFGAQFEGWGVPTGSQIETTDVHSGEQALKVNSNSPTENNNIDQEIGSAVTPVFVPGNTYRISIWYKVLTPQTGGDVKFAGYWNSSRDGELEHDSQILKTDFFTASEWTEKVIETTCPEGATSFYFRLQVAKKAVVFFDDFSIQKVETAEPSLQILPTSLPKVQANINTSVDFEALTIHQSNLTAPVTITIMGTDAAFFSSSVTQATAAEQEVIFTYTPTAVGRHTAMVAFEVAGHSELNLTMRLEGTCIDPTLTPTITLTPTEVPEFTAEAEQSSTFHLTLNSANCLDDIAAQITHVEGEAFVVNAALYPKNMECNVDITFRPSQAGNYHSKLVFSTTNATSVTLDLTGVATEGSGENPELTTEFNWDISNPTTLLNENFENIQHNQMLVIENWQNVVRQWQRPWWGYEHLDADSNIVERSAKATSYKYQTSNPDGIVGEMWLVTPALDYKNAAGKTFTFRVMGDFMFEDHDTNLELYYIDVQGGVPYMQKIEAGIPKTPDLNKEWSEIHMDLTNQSETMADVFFMAFKYIGLMGEDNAVTYYIDDVSWGRTDLPKLMADSAQIVMTASPGVEQYSTAITISGNNLTQDIKISVGGANKSNFELSQTSLPSAGGSFTVKFKSNNEGVHEAYIKIASRGAADIYIPMAVLCKTTTGLKNETVDMDIRYIDNGLQITADGMQGYEVYDVIGRKYDGRATNAESVHIPLTNKGVYIIKVKTEYGTSSRKFVVQ